MANLRISGDTSGVITVAAPAVSGTNTITMPASTGTMALTSDIPAGGGLTLLSTVATTSGTSIVASGLDLSTYKVLMVYAYSVGVTSGGAKFQWKETGGTNAVISYQNVSSTVPYYGVINHNLTNGVSAVNANQYDVLNSDTVRSYMAGTGGQSTNTAIDTATTSITFSTVSGQTFNLGEIKLYGLK
jgi:hypothetical protein|tara:strand:+ start:490 stop:1050 length:561 start_codon:yes stop_codon:yes gene_type:complete